MKRKILNIFTPIDLIFVVWHIVTFLMILLRIYPIENAKLIYAYYGLVILSSVSFFYSTRDVKIKNNLFLVVRYCYAPLFLIVAFSQIELINLMYFDKYLDPLLISLEESIFGFQPCIEFWHAFPNNVFSEYMHMSYFLYYPMFFFVIIYPFIAGKLEAFKRSIFVITFSFLTFYSIYIILPILGPRLGLPESANIPRNGYLFSWIMVQVYKVGGVVGAAFPSSHCGMAIVNMLLIFKFIKPARIPAFITAISICFATVYCRYHYVLDSVAGVVSGFFTFYLSNWFYVKLKQLGFKSFSHRSHKAE